MTLRLLSVHAHPDDESSKGAATLARYAAEGIDVLVATCTGGERGDILNPAVDTAENRANLPAIRRREMAAAAEILGVRHRFLGLTDSGLPAAGQPLPAGSFAALPLAEAAAPLVALIREFRPHVVITYDETGGYPHPDHIRTHEVTVEAFSAAADPARYPGTGLPWQPQKLYYQATLSRAWFLALHEATLAAGLESPMTEVLAELPPEDPVKVTTRIRCEAHFATRDKALRSHTTQVDPAHPFFAHSREIERQAWPYEDYHLAHPTPGPELEDDLFAGVTP
ncbi:mycothiol conjugate amidase Mca [Amycolatopsis sp. SID8362]|uniref:mycothiol conjugate amidase Mca n=1 Tax=Amycolatopsis sp. SID8362 TaxID=2690346 RepID=UPI001367D648|nr:mycothiol conjugate amidase Mca [Amycolatopsis sp. SID8362]NBH09645.1 mycothiol conjugate amidase Mca [Amycolatopsis sp. SID8362]NED46337.1 mycothiol conjugate amidase Mca [Amycolatopsis sp. SID8362]